MEGINCFCPSCHVLFGDSSLIKCTECGFTRPKDGWPILPYPFRNNFVLLKQLGRGGMGAVYKAVVQDTGAMVAIKVARLDRNLEEIKQRFAREMAVANMLSERSPDAFVKVISTDTITQPYYMAMEYVNAPTLDKLVRKVGREVNGVFVVPHILAVRLILSVLQSLSIAHAHMIVHLDIKPENIFMIEVLLPNSVVTYKAKITDLGACIFEGQDNSDAKLVLGTPGYMSPEQILGKEPTRSADVYSVGAVLYELLTGQTPYLPQDGLHGVELLKGFLRNMKADRLQRSDLIPSKLFEILKKALAYNPQDRFISADEFKRALQDYINEEIKENIKKARVLIEKKEVLGKKIRMLSSVVEDLLAISSRLSSLKESIEDIPSNPNEVALQPLIIQKKLDDIDKEFAAVNEMLGQFNKRIEKLESDKRSKITRKLTALFMRDEEDVEDVSAPLLSQSASSKGVEIKEITEITSNNKSEQGTTPKTALRIAVSDPSILLPPCSDRILTIDFSPDGRRLICGTNKGILGIYTLGKNIQKPELFGLHQDVIKFIRFSENGEYVLSSSWDKTVRIFDLNKKRSINVLKGHESGVWGAVFINQDRFVVSISADMSIILWDAKEGRILKRLKNLPEEPVSIAVLPDTSKVITGTRNGKIIVWNVPELKLYKVFSAHENAIRAITVTRSGHYLATGGGSGNIKIWQLSTGKLKGVLKGHVGWIRSLDFHPGQELLASGGTDHTLRLWGKDGTFLGVVGKKVSSVLPVRFSPDGRYLAAPYREHTIGFFDIAPVLNYNL